MSDNTNGVADGPNEVEEAGAIVENVASISELQSTKSLVDLANTTFKSLCETLEKEQQKLMELEQRRKVLQLEMEKLKVEIDEEKKVYQEHMENSNAEGVESSISDLNDEESKPPNESCDIEELDEDTSLWDSNDGEGSNKSDLAIEAIAIEGNDFDGGIEKKNSSKEK